MRRFYLSSLDIQAASARFLTLSGQEARHLAQVLRLQSGEVVEFFDGTGCIVQAQLAELAPDRVTAQVLAARREEPEAFPRLVLVQALLKGKKMDLVVQKANELGASALVPLVTRFCEKREGSEAALARWQRILIESCKQCRRAVPMRIEAVQALAEADFSWAATRLVAWEGEKKQGLPLVRLGADSGPICLIVGPEGGLHADEVAHLVAQDFTAFSLGAQVLRAETAALAAVSLIRYLSGALGACAEQENEED